LDENLILTLNNYDETDWMSARKSLDYCLLPINANRSNEVNEKAKSKGTR
jgi:hypothetical protein